jgi:hypothetical protein
MKASRIALSRGSRLPGGNAGACNNGKNTQEKL